MAGPDRQSIPGLTKPSEPSAYEPRCLIAAGGHFSWERRGKADNEPEFYLYHAGFTPEGGIVVRVLDGTTTQPVLHPPQLMDDHGTTGWSTWLGWCQPTDKDHQDVDWLLGIAKVVDVEPQPVLLTSYKRCTDVVLSAGLNSSGWPLVRVFRRARRVLDGVDLGARLLKWVPYWEDFTGDPAPILAAAETAEWESPPSTEVPPLPTFQPQPWVWRSAPKYDGVKEWLRRDRDSR